MPDAAFPSGIKIRFQSNLRLLRPRMFSPLSLFPSESNSVASLLSEILGYLSCADPGLGMRLIVEWATEAWQTDKRFGGATFGLKPSI